MEEQIISSLQNARVKRLVQLQKKSSERRSQGRFIVEGVREISHLLEAGYEVDTLFCCKDLTSSEEVSERLAEELKSRGLNVTREVYEKMAYRDSTEGIIAIVKERVFSLENLPLGQEAFVVVLEAVEKPGNLGAILRSADGAGADAVIICDPLTDLRNPNLIRSSVGAAFSVPCVACTTDECIAFLKKQGIQILTAQLQDSELYYATDMTRSTAIVMGTEATGLSDSWRKAADRHIRIPMIGRIDSLNVSVSAAILMYEVVRQRSLQGPLT